MNLPDPPVPELGYYLGLPAWGFPGWTGSYFPEPGAGGSTLDHYARVFNTVEGNTSFYRVPDAHIGYLSGFLTMGILLSLPMILAGLAAMIWAARRPAEREPA